MTSRPQMVDESKVETKETSIIQFSNIYTEKIDYFNKYMSKMNARELEESFQSEQDTEWND